MQMKLDFVKYQSLLNDFVIIDNRRRPQFDLSSEEARFLADRRRGVGCDQLILTYPPRSEGAVASYKVMNADGSPAEQCGNGVRCLAHFLGAENPSRFRVDAPTGSLGLECLKNGEVAAEFPPPAFEQSTDGVKIFHDIECGGQSLALGLVSVGNPHAVWRVPRVENADVSGIGEALQHHPRFPQGVNVEFVEVMDVGTVRVRVYERGVGETPACGSGACAVAAVGRAGGWTGSSVQIHFAGGDLAVCHTPTGALRQTGPATEVFHGTLEL